MRARPTLVIMVKEPRPGRVKTRLARDIGTIAAAKWYRTMATCLIRRLHDPRWAIVLAVAPDRAGMQSRVWPAHIMRSPQGRGNLGDRMRRQLVGKTAPCCLIGSDIPGIDKPRIAAAFKALGSADAVFGPAPDGGFWLVGLSNRRNAPPGFFANARWSSKHALADSVATLADHRIAFLDELRDVDTAADLAMTRPGRHATPIP